MSIIFQLVHDVDAIFKTYIFDISVEEEQFEFVKDNLW